MPAVLCKDIQLQGLETKLLYLPTQMRFPIGGERVTRRGSKLPREATTLTLHSHVIKSSSFRPL